MKYILVIGDGMADDPLEELGGKTPLEYARTRAMGALASRGVLGSASTIPEGMPAGSDTAILSIFGCDPALHYGGRAPLEAAATGIALSPGDIAYRCNMVAFEDSDEPFERKKILSHSAGSVEGGISDALISELWGAAEFRDAAKAAGMEVFKGGSFRHIAVQRAKHLRHLKTGEENGVAAVLPIALTPPHDFIGERLGPLLPHGSENAKALAGLMRIAHGILNGHPINEKRREEGKLPANGIWFWAEGIATKLPDFKSKYGKKGSVISAVPLCRGIGTLMGLTVVIVPGATGELDTNYEGKVDAACKVLEDCDFAALHIEAPDECTHNGDLKGKLQAIERVDSRVVAPMAERLSACGTDFRMLVLSDHKTLISTRAHAGGPVPFLLYDSRKDAGTYYMQQQAEANFCEKTAGQSGLRVDGTELMGLLFDETY